ncbi:hypothetical protein HYV12_02370 [Candidatus Dojkabacteria bacterium]|nr:hypothetical protein [Candidatus Dojkabacteria bacterium]
MGLYVKAPIYQSTVFGGEIIENGFMVPQILIDLGGRLCLRQQGLDGVLPDDRIPVGAFSNHESRNNALLVYGEGGIEAVMISDLPSAFEGTQNYVAAWSNFISYSGELIAESSDGALKVYMG